MSQVATSEPASPLVGTLWRQLEDVWEGRRAGAHHWGGCGAGSGERSRRAVDGRGAEQAGRRWQGKDGGSQLWVSLLLPAAHAAPHLSSQGVNTLV